MIGGGLPHLPEILRQTDRVGAKSPFFLSIFARTATSTRLCDGTQVPKSVK